MIRKHFAGFAASALALAVSAQAFAGTVTTDDFIVRVYNGDAGMLIVEITDRLTGEMSEIIVGQN